MALTSRVGAAHVRVDLLRVPSDKIDGLILIHVRLLMHVVALETRE